MKNLLVAAALVMQVVLPCSTGWSNEGPMAELQVGGDIGTPFPLPTASLLVGWRLSEQWSAGLSYSPWRFVFQDMRVLNDVGSSPIGLSGLHATGDFWFNTGTNWGGRAGIQVGTLMPYLGVAEPGNDMSGIVGEGLLSVSWGYQGTHVGCHLYARAGWKWGQIENNTHERDQLGQGPIIIDQIEVSDPTFMTGLALIIW